MSDTPAVMLETRDLARFFDVSRPPCNACSAAKAAARCARSRQINRLSFLSKWATWCTISDLD